MESNAEKYVRFTIPDYGQNEHNGFYQFYHFNWWIEDTKQRNEPKRYRGDNSPWFTIGGLMHYFPGLSENDILWTLTYRNILMYLATIPDHNLVYAPEMESDEDINQFLKKTK